MLSNLYIENIAVIEKVEINFDSGFNVLTGETGAGKSIVIDAINAILGKRIYKNVVRVGKKSAFISATFSNLSSRLEQLIESYGFALEDNGEVIIQREINLEGKSNARINGRPVAMSVLKDIGDNLINIHGQHENYGLFLPEMHLKYLDDFGNLNEDLEKCKSFYEKLKSIKKELDKLSFNEEEKARKIDLLKYQIADLESANLIDGERERLEEERKYLLNKEKIVKSLQRAVQFLNGDENSMGAVSSIEIVNDEITSLKDVYPAISNVSERINDLFYEITDCQSEIVNLMPDENESINKIDEIEERLSILSSLSRKYGSTVQEMLKFLDDAKSELHNIQLSDERVSVLQTEFQKVLSETKLLAKTLSAKRKNVAKKFINLVSKELESLDMPKVKIEIDQKECRLGPNGCDELEFLISTNPGQPSKSISKIASGGELSRMMLAIKNVLSSSLDAQTLIFDEIDTGISGEAAQKVGLKLKELARDRQVICVTHLAPIAALADSHFLIKKEILMDDTFTKIKFLDFESRKEEIARIISGDMISDIMRKNAEEMLKIAKENHVQSFDG